MVIKRAGRASLSCAQSYSVLREVEGTRWLSRKSKSTGTPFDVNCATKLVDCLLFVGKHELSALQLITVSVKLGVGGGGGGGINVETRSGQKWIKLLFSYNDLKKKPKYKIVFFIMDMKMEGLNLYT